MTYLAMRQGRGKRLNLTNPPVFERLVAQPGCLLPFSNEANAPYQIGYTRLANLRLEQQLVVKRIVANISTSNLEAAKAFYGDILEMEIGMDHGWIVTFVGSSQSVPQISFASEGGSGTPVPDLSIEVDDLDGVKSRLVAAGYPLEYGPAIEPWGVERFYVRDPFGKLVNILTHHSQ